jgi:hypothetical protein
MSLKVTSMVANAARAIKRANGTKGGIHLWVGYNGEAIVAGDKVRRSMPHIRIDVKPGAKQEDLELQLGMAVLELKKLLPAAIAKWKAPAPPKPGKAHGWGKKGASGGRR